MTDGITVAIDTMSGDLGHAAVLPAAIKSLDRHPDLGLILVGDRPSLERGLAQRKAQESERLRIHHASQVVGMWDPPSKALRTKKDSSMRVAVDLVREGQARACVSAGNTGALMATARFVLKTLAGIDRPAIISPIPSRDGYTLMLDLGANAECTPEQLFQFAVMGSVLAQAVHGIEQPRVGLLNIGAEETKGNQQIQAAGRLLAASSLNYIGHVEGDDVYLGDVDVVVCDGFVGNVALKTSEGLGKLIAQFLREEFSRNLLTRMAAVAAMPVLHSFRRRVDPRNYNGATFLGLQGIVIKSHGDADSVAFLSAIETALLEVEHSVPARISDLLDSVLGDPPRDCSDAIQSTGCD
ncbi:MAG: phosphate acyltransferase PlsX [Salinisphaera sp.]|nr:phosphate acyltransferase PlsX [Salinisphaera sp.]MDN5937525.1 phosphate acyltransferase PlsX [Salinisphaera sp.]